MTNRKEAVWRLVLNPMQEMFPAPNHLRASDQARKEALRVYEAALIGFDDEVLRTAWEKVAGNRDLWCWPASGEIANACREAQKARPRNGGQSELIDKANELATQYVKGFMKRSRVAARAKNGGWDGELKSYLFEVAWVQAQFLAGVKDVGYSARALKGASPGDSKDVRQQAAEFLKNAREQAAKGTIRVQLPNVLVRDWETEYRGRPAPGPTSRSA
jgi:hypothetical protein